MIGLSVDSVDDHKRWANDIKETQGTAPNFPILADGDFKVATLYDMLPEAASGDPASARRPTITPCAMSSSSIPTKRSG